MEKLDFIWLMNPGFCSHPFLTCGTFQHTGPAYPCLCKPPPLSSLANPPGQSGPAGADPTLLVHNPGTHPTDCTVGSDEPTGTPWRPSSLAPLPWHPRRSVPSPRFPTPSVAPSSGSRIALGTAPPAVVGRAGTSRLVRVEPAGVHNGTGAKSAEGVWECVLSGLLPGSPPCRQLASSPLSGPLSMPRQQWACSFTYPHRGRVAGHPGSRFIFRGCTVSSSNHVLTSPPSLPLSLHLSTSPHPGPSTPALFPALDPRHARHPASPFRHISTWKFKISSWPAAPTQPSVSSTRRSTPPSQR